MPAKLKTKTIQSRLPEYQEAVIAESGCGKGVIRIAAGALSTIVRRAACSVEGVTRITGNSLVDNIAEFVGSKKVMDRAIQIAIQGSSVSVELSINVCYGVSLPEIAADVQQTVANQIKELTSLEAAQINVIIREMEDIADADPEEE